METKSFPSPHGHETSGGMRVPRRISCPTSFIDFNHPSDSPIAIRAFPAAPAPCDADNRSSPSSPGRSSMHRTVTALLVVLMMPLAARARSPSRRRLWRRFRSAGPAPTLLSPLPQIQPIAPIAPIAPFGVRNTGFSAGFNGPGQFRRIAGLWRRLWLVPLLRLWVWRLRLWVWNNLQYGECLSHLLCPRWAIGTRRSLSGLANATLVLQFPPTRRCGSMGRRAKASRRRNGL